MISVIIPWANRTELALALPSIIENIKTIGGDLTIVNLGGCMENLKKQILHCSCRYNINIINIPKVSSFNKSVAQNIGVKYTNNPYLFFCDCDIILPTGLLKEIFLLLIDSPNSFATLAKVKETKINSRNANNLISITNTIKLKIKDGTEISIKDNEENALDGTRTAAGLLMVTRENFKIVNGYNNKFDGWGWEDQDIISRLALYAKLKYITYGVAMHISHNDNVRMKSYIEKYNNRWRSKDLMYRQALHNYDMGNFLGTYEQDYEQIKKVERLISVDGNIQPTISRV